MRKVYFKTVAVRVVFFVFGGVLLSLVVSVWNRRGRFDDLTSAAVPSLVTMANEAITMAATDWATVSRMESDYWRSVRAETMTPRQIVDYLKWSNRSACETVHYFGGFLPVWKSPKGIDGQYPVCLDPPVRPQSSKTKFSFKKFKEMKEKNEHNLDKRLCIVYSVGINGDWSFDEAMAEYGCRVFSFDPSMNVTDHDHSRFVHFFNLGLSDRDHVIDADAGDGGDGKWTMKSLDSIYRMLATAATANKERHHGDDAVIDYLKMDIEWDEWAVLPQIIGSGMLAKIRQLTVEFHLPTKFIPSSRDDDGKSSSSAPPPPSSSPSAAAVVDLSLDDYRRLVAVIQSMEQQHGMIRFESRANPWSVKTIKALDHYVGPTCFEISFYQILAT